MFIYFIIIAIVICLAIFVAKNNLVTKMLSITFLVLLAGINALAYQNYNAVSGHYFKFDAIGLILSLVLCLLSVATFYHSSLYLKRHSFSPKQISRYYVSLIMLITSMMSAYFAENVTVMWVSIEATTLFVSNLIFFERSKDALEAAWKYLFVCSVGVAFAFIGILFLSVTASDNNVTELSLSSLIGIASSMNPIWLKMSFILVLTGFSAKMGLFPLHTVAVDAHTVAPPPISAFISTALMNVGFLGVFRFLAIVSHSSVLHWAMNVLLISGCLSVFMSAIQLLKIKHYKRMFAFSSLEQMGIVALGLGIGGIGYYAAILHIIFHSFVKAGLFYQIGQTYSYFHSYYIKDIKGYFKINPVGSMMLIAGLLLILAIPPSGMFVSEFYIFKSIIFKQHYLLAIFISLMLTLIVYSFSKNIFSLLYGERDNDVVLHKKRVNYYETISQFVLFGLTIYLGVNPPVFLTDLIKSAVGVLN